MKIQAVSVFVDDQQRALEFYSEKLGFAVAADIPMGEHRWLTVMDPDAPTGTQLSLEPKDHPAVPPFTEALVADGIPFCSFAVDDVHAEYERLTAAGVTFTQAPLAQGPVTTAVLDDTVGNLIQLASFAAPGAE
ncbi:VOC family protein [Microbacterium sp. 179-B 1A2 NHS]|uniref:VOC family protein n=1 Tax=Microbacterium sp. 179-B 1A2 NHS TaxID=3142383 RepID=UPI0039A371E7